MTQPSSVDRRHSEHPDRDEVAKHAQRMPEEIGILIRAIYRQMRKGEQKRVSEDELQLPHWLVLKLVSDGEIRRIGQVAGKLRGVNGSPTGIVDELERRGLLMRTRRRGDRRVVEVELTEKGTERLAEDASAARYWREGLSIFSARERGQIFTLLARLADHLLAIDASASASHE